MCRRGEGEEKQVSSNSTTAAVRENDINEFTNEVHNMEDIKMRKDELRHQKIIMMLVVVFHVSSAFL